MADRNVETAADRLEEGGRRIAIEEEGRPLPRVLPLKYEESRWGRRGGCETIEWIIEVRESG
jgi:hypothetical protein